MPLRGAIIGFGNVAIHAHLPVWRQSPRFVIDAVVEPDGERARRAAELLPEARIYPSIEKMLRTNGVDFVDICTPPCFHDDLVLASCRSGLHVFCEKPLTTSTESLREIQTSAARNNKVVFTVNNWKHAPLWIKARELVRDGRIGSVRSISVNVWRSSSSGGGASNWRSDPQMARGGIMIDHGWHNLYLILSLVPDPPVSISARMEPSPDGCGALEETADATIRFPGAEANLHMTWRAPCRRNFGKVEGERGTLTIGDDHILLDTDEKSQVRLDFPEALSAGSHHPEWMECVVEEFSHEISDCGRRGANLLEARRCIELIEMAYRSNREASCAMDVCEPPV